MSIDRVLSPSAAALAAAARTAESRIRSRVRRTPLERSRTLSQACGGEVLVKLENLQPTGSFKIRGATNKILSSGDAAGFVTASSGNHGAAVAYALKETGRHGLVFVPEGASAAKTDKIRSLGADVMSHGQDMVETEAHARRVAAETGAVYVPPYNDAEVAAGQGTVAVEMLEQAERIDRVFIAVGGGGLVSGAAAVLKAARPDVEVWGVSPKNSRVMAESVRAGRVLDLPSQETLSDGTAGGIEADTITFDWCRELVDRWVDVDEGEIAAAMRAFHQETDAIIEGAAGVALAGVLKAGPSAPGEVRAAIVCGGNITAEAFQRVLAC